jgi:pimeloyl-ACP methyl ester carboxylesterase
MYQEPKEFRERFDGVELCWFEWGQAKADEDSILLVHATGFHARCWDQTVSYMPNRHIIALDMRGHGRSEDREPFNWQSFGDDVTAFVRHQNLTRLIGTGHSMGGHSVLQAAVNETARFSRLVLIDPVILPPEAYSEVKPEHYSWLDTEGEHPVARRKNFFDDAEAMYINFHGRGSFAVWEDKALDDYCRYGLLPMEKGRGYRLACPPAIEAAIYMGSSGYNVVDRIREIEMPVKVIRAKVRDHDRAEMDFSLSPTWDKLASCFKNGKDIHLPELTHFMPMQAPELVATHILSHAFV